MNAKSAMKPFFFWGGGGVDFCIPRSEERKFLSEFSINFIGNK